MTKKTEWYDVIKPTKEDFEKDAIKQLRIAKERLAEIAGYKEELAKENQYDEEAVKYWKGLIREARKEYNEAIEAARMYAGE